MKIGMTHDESGSGSSAQLLSRIVQRDLHQHKNKPYKIVTNDTVGRHMVASRAIKAGEIIFEEEPLTFGPSEETKPICLGCYVPLESAKFVCSICGFPMCSKKCSQLPEHKNQECKMFAESGYKVNAKDFKYGQPEPAYAIISVLRALCLRKQNPEKWDLLWSHMSHLDQRRQSKYWMDRTATFFQQLKQAKIEVRAEDAEVIEAILGILLVNDFEVGIVGPADTFSSPSSSPIRALFALASMPSHSCVANTTHDFQGREKNFRMVTRAVVPIPKGSEILHSYTEPLDPLLTRRSILSLGKFFLCWCERCASATEMGTFSSALRCGACDDPDAAVLPSKLDDLESAWSCDKCGKSTSCEKVQATLRAVKVELESLDSSPSIEGHETFVRRFSRALHPNHVFLVEAQYNLAKMYGRMAGFEPDKLTDEQFARKLALCRRVMAVLDTLMPGRSRKRGVLLYEMHLPLVMRANRALQRGPGAPGVDPAQIKKDLRAGLTCLTEGLDILRDEPEGSFEAKIVEGSEESVKQLKDWVQTIEAAL